MAKYVFVTGGVTSSLGKGITAASIGRLLKEEKIADHRPRIGGDDVTTFPALEIYRDRGGTTTPLAFRKSRATSFGSIFSPSTL